MVESASVFRMRASPSVDARGASRSPSDLLRVIRGRSNGSGETRATALPKPSAALFAQVLLATNCRARFSASGGRLALSVRGIFAAPAFGGAMAKRRGRVEWSRIGSIRVG